MRHQFAASAVVLFLSVSPFAIAEEPVDSKEPAAVVAARKDYQAKIKAATDPITGAYLKKLNAMMKSYGAEGDLDKAQAVQAEIKRFQHPARPLHPIVGKWTYPF